MAANAPYYQMRAGQFITTPNSTNATPSRFVTEDDEYCAVASQHEHQPSMYSEHTARQTSTDMPMYTTEENHNLAELLEAATTAAGQAAQAMDAHDAVTTTTEARGKGKRKRASSSPVDDDATAPRTEAAMAPKRRRVDVPTDPQLQSTAHEARGNSENDSVPPSSEWLLNDARAAGVHSAAALFRRPSEKTSRKYTRPPMSKLFMSLQLSPENFLQLQAQAKAYMLDTAYPERQNCVGNRGKSDTDMVKLRLFNCVRDFLTDGVGEDFFGENVEKPGEKDTIEAARALGQDKAPSTEERLTWPRDGNKIISLVTPLMRRMVTNERQRMYAIETRKGGAKKKDKEDSLEADVQQAHSSLSDNSPQGHSVEQQLLPAFDPGLVRVVQTSQPASPSALSTTVLSPVTPSSIAIVDMSKYSNMVEDELLNSHLQNVDLPSDGPEVPCIKNINIFLVLADHKLPSGTVKPGVKLSEKRLVSNGPIDLTKKSWDDLLTEAMKLIARAKSRYPAIGTRFVPSERCDTVISTTTSSPDYLKDTLRELAAAANAIQTSNSDANEQDHRLGQLMITELNAAERTSAETIRPLHKEPTASPFAVTDHSQQLEAPQLRFAVKTVGPNGWENISNDAQWQALLLRRGLEIWADGVINLIVELVDVPVPMERAAGGKVANVPATSEKYEGKGKEKMPEMDSIAEHAEDD